MKIGKWLFAQDCIRLELELSNVSLEKKVHWVPFKNIYFYFSGSLSSRKGGKGERGSEGAYSSLHRFPPDTCSCWGWPWLRPGSPNSTRASTQGAAPHICDPSPAPPGVQISKTLDWKQRSHKWNQAEKFIPSQSVCSSLWWCICCDRSKAVLVPAVNSSQC